jgi:hypothetical protein
MRTVYATQFTVGDGAHGNAWDGLLEVVSGWVGRYYQNRKIEIAFPFDNGELIPCPEHRISVNALELSPEKRFWKLDWIHPDDYDSTLLWHTQATLALSGAEIEFGIVVRIASKSFTVMPARFTLGRPWLVKKIATDFECKTGVRRITPTPFHLPASEIDDFVNSALMNSHRALPVVLVSNAPNKGEPVIDVNKLADTLVGLAEVYVLADKWAAFRLTDAVGQSLSCFNGAVRVYWPDFSLDSNPFHHPLWLGNNIKWHEENGRSFYEYLLRMLSTIASFRHTDGSLTKAIRDEADARRQHHIDEQRQEIKKGNYDRKQAEKFLDEVAEENDTLRRERDDATERLSELQERLRTAEENLAAVYQYAGQNQEPDTSGQQQDADITLSNVREAVEHAAEKFSESLIFLPSAFDSAQDSPFKRPNRVYEALEAINEVCLEWADSLRTGEPMGQSWIEAFRKRGFDYKDSVSTTSKGKYEDDYYFTYEGQRILFEQHITEGAKQPDKCFSIHMCRDYEKRKIAIGHVGRHLTNTNT